MAQSSGDDHVVLGDRGTCERVRTMGAPPQLRGAVQEVQPPRRGQRTGGSWLRAFVGLTPLLCGPLVLWVPAACLHTAACLCPPLCCLDLKGRHSWRAGRVQRGCCRWAVSQPAASATLPSGSDWLDSCSGVSPCPPLPLSVLRVALPTRTRGSVLKFQLLQAELCPPRFVC